MTFGLSMDYEIFLLTRIRERFLQTSNTRDAVAYGVSTSARTITSAALIMIAVFIGFAFAGMPLVAQLGVACAVAIAVDATVVRLVLVPALMAMFDEWNWWLPRWLDRILPSVDFEKPLPKVEIDDLVIIPDDISALAAVRLGHADGGQVRGKAEKPCARYHHRRRPAGVQWLPDADKPRAPYQGRRRVAAVRRPARVNAVTNGRTHRNGGANGNGKALPPSCAGTSGHHVAGPAVGRARRSETEAEADRRRWNGSSPMETTNVQLPTGDRLQIPTGAETLRLKSYLIMCRNSTRDYAEFAELVESMETQTAAVVLAGMDRYYCGQQSRKQWVATQLVRRLADPQPSDEHDTRMSGPEADADWAKVRQRCLSVAVAMLEEAK